MAIEGQDFRPDIIRDSSDVGEVEHNPRLTLVGWLRYLENRIEALENQIGEKPDE